MSDTPPHSEPAHDQPTPPPPPMAPPAGAPIGAPQPQPAWSPLDSNPPSVSQPQFGAPQPPFGAAPGYGPPGFPQPGFAPAPGVQKETNGLAVSAMIVGIASILTFWMCGLGALGGLVAVVLGILGLSTANKSPTRPFRGQAIAGIVTGALAVMLGIGVLALIFLTGSTVDEFDTGYNGGGDTTDEMNSDASDGSCDVERFVQDPDC